MNSDMFDNFISFIGVEFDLKFFLPSVRLFFLHLCLYKENLKTSIYVFERVLMIMVNSNKCNFLIILPQSQNKSTSSVVLSQTIFSLIKFLEMNINSYTPNQYYQIQHEINIHNILTWGHRFFLFSMHEVEVGLT